MGLLSQNTRPLSCIVLDDTMWHTSSMARNKNTSNGRDYKSIASRRLPQQNLLNSYLPQPSHYLNRMRMLQIRASRIDHRLYNPTPRPFRKERLINGNPASFHTVFRSIRKSSYPTARYVFSVPKNTAVCVRRAVRKEVIFASGNGGRRLRTQRVRRTPSSDISCKR